MPLQELAWEVLLHSDHLFGLPGTDLLLGEGGSAGDALCSQPRLCIALPWWLNLFRIAWYRRVFCIPFSWQWDCRMLKVGWGQQVLCCEMVGEEEALEPGWLLLLVSWERAGGSA